MSDLQSQYLTVKKEIPEDVQLVAVSKTQSIEAMIAVYHLGQRIFGENYVQELIEKFKKFKELGLTEVSFHFIGHLQTNKVKLLLPYVDCIESVDSLRLLLEIERQAQALSKRIPCFFQLNIDEENSKGGFHVSELDQLVEQVKNCSFIDPRGLMIIPDPERNFENAFQRTRALSQKYGFSLGAGLSMGMSHDYKLAIQSGSTMVRVGSKIFGERKTRP